MDSFETLQEVRFYGSEVIAERYWVCENPLSLAPSTMWTYHRLANARRKAFQLRRQGIECNIWDQHGQKWIEG